MGLRTLVCLGGRGGLGYTRRVLVHQHGLSFLYGATGDIMRSLERETAARSMKTAARRRGVPTVVTFTAAAAAAVIGDLSCGPYPGTRLPATGIFF